MRDLDNKFKLLLILVVVLGLVGLAAGRKAETKEYKTATFAGGCFWCMEPPFEKLKGVSGVTSGFAGGTKENPSYKEVASGKTDYLETVQVKYNPEQISYTKLVKVFWQQINPTDDGGQFVDRGYQYTTAVFYHNQKQKEVARRSKQKLNQSDIFSAPIVTEIRPFNKFYPAHDGHQDYYKQNPVSYKFYRFRSGRDDYLEKTWDQQSREKLNQIFNSLTEDKTAKKEAEYMKPSQEEIKQKLTDLQYKVTQKNATERAFNNKYWDNQQPGIYVDVVSGEPLFSSQDKFKSGTGWPSFTRPLVPENIVEKKDRGLFSTRTEVRSKHGDSHLGHVFEDGPEPTGLRYCINSAALEFIPKDKLKEEGYEEFLQEFKEGK